MSTMIRAFLSIDIEDYGLISRISEIQQQLNPKGAKMKIVESENIHFTIRFFGDITQERIDEIRECVEQVRIAPFEIRVQGVGAFPSKRRPRVIWIGISENAEQIVNLKMRIDKLLVEIGYESEKEKLIPHATIARVRSIKDSGLVIRNLEELADEPIGSMIVKSVSMKKSTLTSSGPVYETLWTAQ